MKQHYLTLLFIVSATSLFGQTANFWTKKADFGGMKRERAIAFTIGNKAYVGTGVDTAEVVHRDLWEYDPLTDVWMQKADNPGQPRRNAVAFTIQGFGYIGTGINANSSTESGATKLKDFWRYDAALNTWTQVADYPGSGGNGVYFATGFAVDSKGYLCGGKMGPNYYSNQMWEYKPSLNQWTQLPNFPGGVRYQLSSFAIDFAGYVGLGTDQDMYRKDFWKFDVASNQWSQIANLPASERSSAMTFTLGQRGFVCMGTNGGDLGDLWEYNPFTNDWSSKAPYEGSERKGGVGFSINGKGYVGTGKGESGKKESMYEYTPSEVLEVNELTAQVELYPNPTVDKINLTYNAAAIQSFKIYSAMGREIISADQVSHIDVSDLPSGTYLLFAMDHQQNVVSNYKFIKQ